MMQKYRFPTAYCALSVILAQIPQIGAAAEIHVDTNERHQTIEGFGASINGWNSQTIPIYSEDEFIDFVVDELGLSMFRMQVWPRVFETPVEDWEDISHEDFVWTGSAARAQINSDFAVALRQRSPEIRIIGSIWSPPGWMKENGSITGTRSGFLLSPGADHNNRLKDDLYQHYAKFLVEYQKALIARGIGLYAFGAQNEPMFTQTFESNLMSGEEYARLIRTLGQMYEHEGLEKPLFYGPEDMTLANYNPNATGSDATRHNPYVENLMAEGTAEYFDIWATHGYSDGVNTGSAMDPGKYWNSIKQFGRPYWITEGGTGGHQWPAPVRNGVAAHLHHALTEGNVSAFVSWQITDPVANEHGLMHLRTPTKKTYAAMHYWRFIRPGAVRVSAEADTGSIRASAYTDDRNHQLVIVAINTGQSRDVTVSLEGSAGAGSFTVYRTSSQENVEEVATVAVEAGAISIEMESDSIVTLVGMHEGWQWDDALGPIWDAGEDWVWHDVLGWTYMAVYPAVYTPARGWQHIVQGDYVKGLYTYDFDDGWFFISKTQAPWIYSYSRSAWEIDPGP